MKFKEIVRPTTVIRADSLSRYLGLHVTLATETFQLTGSFKFRAAFHLASNVPNQHILTASSGNFGQALAFACRLLGKACTVVMPVTSAAVKVDAVLEHRGYVEFVDTHHMSRQAKVAELAHKNPDAYVASPYDDPLVIEGNASLAVELMNLGLKFDYIIAPIGGGGLASGIIRGIRCQGHSCAARNVEVIGAEPLSANDAARSLKAGYIVKNQHEPLTLADGARTVSLGKLNWEIIKIGLDKIVEVPEEKIKEAVRLLYGLANLKAEPTGALSLAAVLTEPEAFRCKSVCCVISGGNVDAEVYARLITG